MIKRILQISDALGGHIPVEVSCGHGYLVPPEHRRPENCRIFINQDNDCSVCGSDQDFTIELTMGQIDSLCEALQDMRLVLEQRLDARGNQ